MHVCKHAARRQRWTYHVHNMFTAYPYICAIQEICMDVLWLHRQCRSTLRPSLKQASPSSMRDTHTLPSHFCWMPAMVAASALLALARSRASLCRERRNSRSSWTDRSTCKCWRAHTLRHGQPTAVVLAALAAQLPHACCCEQMVHSSCVLAGPPRSVAAQLAPSCEVLQTTRHLQHSLQAARTHCMVGVGSNWEAWARLLLKPECTGPLKQRVNGVQRRGRG